MGKKKSLKKIPHLFGKTIVFLCIVCGIAFSFYALRILGNTGHDPAALLGVILAFLGGELTMLCLKTILSKGDRKDGEV